MQFSRPRATFFRVSMLAMALGASAVTSAAPMSLVEAYQSALARNLQLRSEQAYTDAERESVTEAWSTVKPQVDLVGGYGITRYKRESAFGPTIEDSDRNRRIDLSISQVIYSRQAFKGISRARAAEGRALADLESTRGDISLRVVEAYLDVVKLQRQIDVVNSERESHQRRLDQITGLLERGFATKAEKLEAQARIDEISARLIQFQNDHRVALQMLSQVTGQPVEAAVAVNESVWQATPALLEAPWVKLALANAPNIGIAQSELALAEVTEEYETAGHYPELSLRARYTDNDTFATDLTEEARVELQLSIPIYKGGRTSARARGAAYRVTGAELKLEGERENVLTQVNRLQAVLQGSYSNIKALKTALSSNRASEEAAEEGFSAGIRNLNDLLDIRTRRSRIEQDLIEAIYANLLRQAELQYLGGELTAEDLALLQ